MTPDNGVDIMITSIRRQRLGLAIIAALTGLTLVTGCGGGSTPAGQNSGSASKPASAAKIYQVGIAQIVSHPSLDAIRQGVKDGLKDQGFVEGVNIKFDEQNPQGDQAALTSIANNFKSANKDLIVAITTPAALSIAQAIADKPIIFAGVTDPVSAKLVASWDAPGGNLTGTSDYPPIKDQIKLVKDVKPTAKSLGIVYSSAEVNAEVQANLAKQAAAEMGMTVRTATVSNSSEIQQAAKSLQGVDAFYVGNDNTLVSGIEGLVQVAEQFKVPVIVSDPDSVGRGATAAYAIDQHTMGYNAGLMAAKVLKEGAKPATMPVQKQTDLMLVINPAAAQRQGVTLSDDLIKRANRIL